VAHARRRRPRPKAARRGVPASTRGQPRARAPRRAARSVPAGHEPPSPVARPRHRRPHPHPRPTCSTARPPKRVDRRTSCAQARRRVVHRPPPRRRGPCGVLYVGVCVPAAPDSGSRAAHPARGWRRVGGAARHPWNGWWSGTGRHCRQRRACPARNERSRSEWTSVDRL